MATVIFVHGTGVRKKEYHQSFQMLEQRLSPLPGVHVSCRLPLPYSHHVTTYFSNPGAWEILPPETGRLRD